MQNATHAGLLTQSEYARSRSLNPSTVSRQIRDGIFKLVDGMVDPVAADAGRALNLHPSRGRRKPPAVAAVKSERQHEHRPEVAVPPSHPDRKLAVETLSDARLRKESALADLQEMECSERRGELVLAVNVRDQAFAAARSIRDAILSIPDRLAAILAAESETGKVHAILSDEFRAVLTDSAMKLNELSASLQPGIDAGSASVGVGVGGQEPAASPASRG